MKNNPYHIEDQLKFLHSNLEQGAALFTTEEGRKAYFKSLLIEIQTVIQTVKEGIVLIQRNTNLFPNKPLFKTDFVQLDDDIQSAWENMQEKHELGKSLAKLDKAIQELREQLQIAHSCLNNPEACKMIEFFHVLWNKFEQKIWPTKAQELQTKVLAGLSHNTATRRRQLLNKMKFALDQLNAHPIAVMTLIEMEGNFMDEISHDGRLVADALAPTIFNNRECLGSNKCIYDFFSSFMTYQVLKAECDKTSPTRTTESQNDMETWLLDIGNKLLCEVKTDYQQRFPQLCKDLCRQHDLMEAFKHGTLKSPFNLKLAYNLIGVMKRKGLFSDTSFIALSGLVSKPRQDQYIKAGYYDEEKDSELNPKLYQEACNIIDAWMKKSR